LFKLTLATGIAVVTPAMAVATGGAKQLAGDCVAGVATLVAVIPAAALAQITEFAATESKGSGAAARASTGRASSRAGGTQRQPISEATETARLIVPSSDPELDRSDPHRLFTP